MVNTTLENLRKTFDDGRVVAVDGIELHIEEGELIVLVGPSGCGKSTTLRCIAGLEEPDQGRILFGDTDVTKLSPKDRAISMVFQNYALYPSMTVYENMAFGLRMRGYDIQEVDDQVTWAADMMDIRNLLDRYPDQLSGGQQQRVALGRSIVREPTLFLLDEPLSNLDAKLRSTMRTEIQELQRELQVATVFVTHDQQEAMTIGDRIAVMNDGQMEQVDTPTKIYHDPQSLFVADFIGEPAINFFDMDVDGDEVGNADLTVSLPTLVADKLRAGLDGSRTIMGVRPESLNAVDPGDGVLDADIEVIEPLGDQQIVYFNLSGGQRVRLVTRSTADFEENETIGVAVEWPETHFFSPEGPKIVKWRHAVETEQPASTGLNEGERQARTGETDT